MHALPGFWLTRRATLAAIGWLLICPGFVRAATAEQSLDDLSAARQKLYAAYSTQLHDLAAACETDGLTKQAQLTKAWLPQRDPTMIYVFTLPDSSAAPSSLIENPKAQKWWDRFMELRRAQADRLFALAQSALAAKQYGVAFDLARETVRENPDHEAARRVLGDRKYASGDANPRWVSPETARRLDAGQVWSDQFGWLPAGQLKRYENGQRFYRGNWINAAEDARLHSNIHNGWTVDSDHFQIVTNHSLKEGVKLASQLEKLYDAWRQVFVGYYATPAQVEQWFAAAGSNSSMADKVGVLAQTTDHGGEFSIPSGAESAGSHKLHHVVYFHDKQQYIAALEAAQPQIEMSIGFYSDTAHTAYLYASDDAYVGTLYHEETHQLFHEMLSNAHDPGRKNNFWIVEGIACYMESLAEHRLIDDEPYGSYITLGGENGGRVPAARKRLLDDGFYVPFRELVADGMVELQHHPQLPAIYSQISGQAWFLMHADQGRYRAPLMNYLAAVYTGHATLDTLEKLTGQTFEQLDAQYREFLK